MENEKVGSTKGFNYKTVFEQPFWIQKISDYIVLDEPLRFSFFVYGAVAYGVMFLGVNRLIGFLPWGLRDVLIDGVVAYLCAKHLSDLRIEGQSIFKAVCQFVMQYFRFEKHKKGLYYAGQFYPEGIEGVSFEKDE